MEFGQKLKEARTKAGLKQEQVAKELGVTRQTMSNWENDRSYPDLASVLKLSDLYGISVEEMLREDGNLRKKVEQRQEAIKRYCSWTHDFGILLMPVAFVLAYFGKTGGGIFLAAMSFVIFCVPHVVYVRRFDVSWKPILLRIVAVGMWLTGVMLRRTVGDLLTDGWALVYGGLLLQIIANYRLRSYPGMITKRMTAFSGFVVAVVLILAFVPAVSQSMEKGDFNEANPFNHRKYRVVETLKGDSDHLPMVQLSVNNRVYMDFPGEKERELGGQFTYVTQPDNSPYKGVWEMIPEDAVWERYQVAVDGDGSVVLAGYDGSEIQWKYRLEYAPEMGVTIVDLLGVATGTAPWFEGACDPVDRPWGISLNGKGEVRLSIPGNPERITVLEEYYKDGSVEYREYKLEKKRRNRYIMKLAADKEAEEEYHVFRIPHEDGEFVLTVRMKP